MAPELGITLPGDSAADNTGETELSKSKFSQTLQKTVPSSAHETQIAMDDTPVDLEKNGPALRAQHPVLNPPQAAQVYGTTSKPLLAKFFSLMRKGFGFS